ncbi:hypothetical protein [Lentibacillus sediminis]|uniref:hypothetical protein n=1 Tax=Lentibacillus sediminis TaxID=1940529 RepID=UPI000C1BBF71|nr:hypothetical protein [Lentibacillus sediminis]
MVYAHYIRQGLYNQGLPVYETDIPFIQNILYTVEQAESSLGAFPYLNQEVPITVVDKELMR